MKTQFMHIMTQDHGGVTLAIRREELQGDDVAYAVGAAYASPAERQFDRKRGRLIAEGRLEAQRHGSLTFTRKENTKKDSITKDEMIRLLPKLRTRSRRDATLFGPDWFGGFFKTVCTRYKSAYKENK